ncbi:uncharacterized protein Z518_05721 [Rhinocladiella mackenziei CBS 650.93]|uniref:Major facilitator superfamily (MFS) profile domain-containing protein n=1 Tax=Rhinocladiella mackenziei CBS 650.93 TaxID=1442369 RepID=A0A0D2J6Z3_9EURO|nr:uncharacterized protein Z518_05721 [Rhinocladiella mackenziei CBS 650.93]KIX04850.1 hypothetical protein Z518_05721 [Rhinocladiella mackenziei CBS 650.93]
MKKSFTFWEYLYYAAPIFLEGFTAGWETGSIGGILAMPQFLNYFNYPSDFRQGSMTACLLAGEFGGSLFMGFFLADRLGRKRTIYVAVMLYLIGQIIVVASVGRVLNGFGAGGLIQTVPLYTAEVAPVWIRGRLGYNLNAGTAMGLFATYWVQYGSQNIGNNGAWRMPLSLQFIPVMVLASLIFWRPESPRWLFMQDRLEEALQVLAKLHGEGNPNDETVKSEYQEIRIINEYEKSMPAPSLYALFFRKEYRRRTVLGAGIQFLHEISGPNICLYYAPKVFTQVGVSGTQASLLANGINGALLVVTSLSLMWMADKYGRRNQMTIGPLCMGTCFLVVGGLMRGYGSPHWDSTTQSVQFSFHNQVASKAAIAFMYLYMAAFGAIYCAVGQTYPNEVFSLRARSRGAALGASMNWLVNFWLGLYIPYALNKASWKMYLVFAGFNCMNTILCYLFFPETARRTLEEIDLLFTSDRTVFVFLDKEAVRKGRLLHSDLTDGETVAQEMKKALHQHGNMRVWSSDVPLQGKEIKDVQHSHKEVA